MTTLLEKFDAYKKLEQQRVSLVALERVRADYGDPDRDPNNKWVRYGKPSWAVIEQKIQEAHKNINHLTEIINSVENESPKEDVRNVYLTLSVKDAELLIKAINFCLTSTEENTVIVPQYVRNRLKVGIENAATK